MAALPRRAHALARALSAAILFGSGACELAVRDAIPLFLCEPGSGTCPTSQVCAPSTHRCVPTSQACTVGGCPARMQCDNGTLACVPAEASVVAVDGSSGDDATMGEDEGEGSLADVSGAFTDATAPGDELAPLDAAAPEAAARCHGGIGCGCSVSRDCNSGLCVNQPGAVTRDIWNASRRHAFCSETCCTSADCDPGSVCFATGVGGNYCVPAGWLGDRAAAPGVKAGGEECVQESECRSGLCAMGACADTCCSGRAGNQCGPGSACRFGDFQGANFDSHHTARCASPTVGGSANAVDCTSNGACRSNLCVGPGGNFPSCHDACRGAGDCSGQNQVCSYIAAGNTTGDVFAACVTAGAPVNGQQQGMACRSASDCQSGLCDGMGQCTDVCFADSDCPFAGWHCRPTNMSVFGGGGGTYSVLTCGQ
ncbi:MAG: hypothetical protein M3O50_07440 [Myxococcota bacterium]|nr:hypothetical protein [Myxococcota bacterium]